VSSEPLASAVEAVRLLNRFGQSVAVAESLTGGLACSALVDVPGASAVLRGGVVAYATPLKHQLLGVDDVLLAARGPVDPEVARQMALGVADRLGADWGIATTGVAGPDPQDGVPPGRVYVAVVGPGGTGRAEGAGTVLELDLTGDRAQIRAKTAIRVVDLLVAVLTDR
jgi:nicotinamide-nucleotide amidase